MTIRVFMPHFSILGVPLYPSLKKAKKAGYYGVEIHLAAKSMSKAMDIRRQAKILGLDIHWHQGWSKEEDESGLMLNKILDFFEQLPKPGYTLENHIPRTSDPTVIYVERLNEIGANKNWWVQTACYSYSKKGNNLRVSLEKFLEKVESIDIKIVFDVQHFLEWYYEVIGVSDLPAKTLKLLKKLEYGWEKLGKRVKEIHLTDTNPALGNDKGRNVYFGKGILPLKEFCGMVRDSGWGGVVVPEVSPIEYRKRGAKTVLENTLEYFE